MNFCKITEFIEIDENGICPNGYVLSSFPSGIPTIFC